MDTPSLAAPWELVSPASDESGDIETWRMQVPQGWIVCTLRMPPSLVHAEQSEAVINQVFIPDPHHFWLLSPPEQSAIETLFWTLDLERGFQKRVWGNGKDSLVLVRHPRSSWAICLREADDEVHFTFGQIAGKAHVRGTLSPRWHDDGTSLEDLMTLLQEKTFHELEGVL